MSTVFFSYSHKDEALRDELETHLAMLKREGAIESWHDRKIPAGDVLDSAIDTQLDAADIVLLLVSPDFLASRYCYDVEVQRAMARHEQRLARVIPVILRPCDWHGAPFGKLLAAPQDGKPVTRWPDRDEAFLDVVKQIRAALPASPPAARPAPAPMPVATSAFAASPRSSNLRLRKEFSEADQDRFLEESFEFMARYFEGSLTELQERNVGIEARFKRIDAQTFTAVIYQQGKTKARCAIHAGGRRSFGSGITYSQDDTARGNSFNESLSVVVGEQSLSLKPTMAMNFHMQSNRPAHLSQQGAAEYYWSMLIKPLQ